VLLRSGRTTDMAHALWRAVARKGDLAVDATAGNGWDTAYLAELVLGDAREDPGLVLAFDVQQSALLATRRRVDERFEQEKASRVRLVLDSHANLQEYVAREVDTINTHDGGVGVICFNLGYLPGKDSDKTVATKTESTVAAVRAAVLSLRPGGVLTVVGYVGHEGGAEETSAVEALTRTLDPKQFTATTHLVVNRENCPRLIVVHRKED
jgi:predicted methyltransferase